MTFTSTKEIIFSLAFVCLSVFLPVGLAVGLSVSKITQKVMNGQQRNFMEGSEVVKGSSD